MRMRARKEDGKGSLGQREKSFLSNENLGNFTEEGTFEPSSQRKGQTTFDV